MNPEILCFGEVLIDFSQHGPGPLGYPAYEALPGGAPANVAVALARWGHRVAFSSRVGSDALGNLLKATLEAQGVDVSSVASVPRPTTMAIVSLDAHGDRSFDILWQGTSCAGLPTAEPIPGRVPRVFHFGSVSMCDSEGRRATLASARAHRAAGSLVSFDPNLRPRLWSSLDEARAAIEEGLQLADVVKIAEEEVAFLLGEALADPAEQAARFVARYQIPMLFVTLGPQGCLWFAKHERGAVPTPRVNVVDTTGAGDCFMAGVLHCLLSSTQAPETLNAEAFRSWASFGVASGSASTTARGGIPSIPTLGVVQTLINEAR